MLRKLLFGIGVGLGLALAQGLVKDLTPPEVEGFLREMGMVYKKKGDRIYVLTLEQPRAVRVVLVLDACEENRCAVVALVTIFGKQVSLERLNQWNRDRRFSRAYKDEEGDTWLEWELDLEKGVTLEAVKEFLRFFIEETLPAFMEHIGVKP
ncbi:MAG: YbjN domain-containing protein [Thermus sp.]|nr:YbjN domain-containing protein [Thermus sp.]